MHRLKAEQATMQSFLNCYLREVKNFEWMDKQTFVEKVHYKVEHLIATTDQYILIPLHHHQMEILIAVKYKSKTERHLFSFPIYYRSINQKNWLEMDVVTLITLLTKELTLTENISVFPEELIYRTMQSCQHIQSYLKSRKEDDLYQSEFSFLDAEQSLIFGHLQHPTPKSRQGIAEVDAPKYSPELKGQFPLHYFRVHSSIVEEDSSTHRSATMWIKEELLLDPDLDPDFKSKYCQVDDYSIIPVHPLQAQYLLARAEVNELLEKGLVINLGIQGRAYYPTSSIRTLYHPQSSFMLKCSLHVKITNSLRVNKRKELERGVEVSQMMIGRIGQEMREKFPFFHVIHDPAYITLSISGKEESGFELVLRENPFPTGRERNVTLIAGLSQDSLNDGDIRLTTIIKRIARKEGRQVHEVSLDWFKRYLGISFKPMMELYLRFGIALEAHQQNSIVQLHEGYPHQFYYRDNQGYYYADSKFPLLESILPGISIKSQTRCADSVADERLRYYLFFNHLFGLINAFGTANLVDEKILLDELGSELKQLEVVNRASSELIPSLLYEEKLTCKSNLLTRVYDMDELVSPMENQSVYVPVENPLYQGVRVNGITTS